MNGLGFAGKRGFGKSQTPLPPASLLPPVVCSYNGNSGFERGCAYSKQVVKNFLLRTNCLTPLYKRLLPGPKRPAFSLTACTNVRIEKNDFRTNEKPIVNLESMRGKDVKTDITGLTFQEF